MFVFPILKWGNSLPCSSLQDFLLSLKITERNSHILVDRSMDLRKQRERRSDLLDLKPCLTFQDQTNTKFLVHSRESSRQ